jgi:hypothetical protein
MRHSRLNTYVLAAALVISTGVSAARAQQQPPTTLRYTAQQFDIEIAIVTLDASDDPLNSLFAEADTISQTLPTGELSKLIATASRTPNNLRTEKRMASAAAPGQPVNLFTDAPAGSPTRVRAGGSTYTINERKLQVRVYEKIAEGASYYVAELDLRGPLGGLRATFIVTPQESAVFALPGNFMAQTPPDGKERRAAYALIRITKSERTTSAEQYATAHPRPRTDDPPNEISDNRTRTNRTD